MINKFLTIAIVMCVTTHLNAQKLYSIDASKVVSDARTGHFKMGSAGPAGKEMVINSRYMTIGGKAVVPVMGELQFTRVPKERWEDEILKMKAAGINIVATYLFWNHHEEIEGQFDWSGGKDLRAFVKLCKDLGVLVYPRLGPWAHGEARNGGTPDWILRKKYLVDRSNDPVYQSYVDRYFKEIGKQLQDMMYKDGGPVVGVQLENEYTKGKAGEPHILWLKQTAMKYGIDVPMYTVTGWGDGSVPPNEVIPLWGAYPDESWQPNVEKITGCGNYQFDAFRDDVTIGTALAQREDRYMDYSLDPYFTCELGVGIFTSSHRRPILDKRDGMGILVNKIGSGGNLLGYYIYAGGSYPVGIYNTNEEEKDKTGYWTESAMISYDFQAAIRENGMLAPSYFESKRLNYFLNEFGEQLAPMEPSFGPKANNELQYAVRAKDNSAFLFGINYCRNNVTAEKKNVQFEVKLKDETVRFPSKPINIKDSSIFIWPVNLNMNGTLLKYATAQPLCKLDAGKQKIWVFVQDVKIAPEFCIDGANVQKLVAANGSVENKAGRYIISNIKPGSDCVLSITTKNGIEQKLVVLSYEEGLDTWLLRNAKNEKQFFISRAGLYMKNNELFVTDTLPNMRVKMLTGSGFLKTGENIKQSSEELFTVYNIQRPVKKITSAYVQRPALYGAEWLKTSVDTIRPDIQLYHRLFQKEFSIGNPASIKSAKLIIANESDCRFRINERYCEQTVQPNVLNVLDVTGYMQKGDNLILMDFPYAAGDEAFAAKLLVEYFNADKFEMVTDASWLTADSYFFPPTFGNNVYTINYAAPVITKPRAVLQQKTLPGINSWMLQIPCSFLDGLNNVYLGLNYVGNKVEVRSGSKLIADCFNSNNTWFMDLKRNGSQMECSSLQIDIKPWKNIDNIYFDIAPAKADEGKAAIQSLRFVPEYREVLETE